MKKSLLALISITLLSCSTKQQDVKTIVSKANIVYDSVWFQKGHAHVPLYVANGIIGGCFDHMGFQSRPNTGIPEGRTTIGYIGHYGTIANGRQIQFPLATIEASFSDGSSVYNLIDAKDYKQELDLFTGCLRTSYDLFGKTEITAFASQQHANLFVFHVNRESYNPAKKLVLNIECETSTCQNNDTKSVVDKVDVSIIIEKDLARIRSKTNATFTDWLVYCPGAGFEIKGTQLLIYLNDGENDLRLFVSHPSCSPENCLNENYTAIFDAHKNIWMNVWNQSWIDFPEERAHNIWTRMNYYTLCNFPLIAEKPMIPTGLNSNIWGFTFPQDVYYVAENLPRTGHFDRAEKAIQYWLEVLPEARKYGRRIMGVEGAYYPWTPPYNNWDDYEKDEVNGADSYELHNPAYVAAIVWHYYKYSSDTVFLRKYYPVIRDVFEFYKNISSKNNEGTYDIYHEKARGQDEASSTDGKLKNLLCAGYSTEYMARMIVEASSISGDTSWRSIAVDIVKCGVNRKNLLRPNGIYTTFEGDNRTMGSQKHPVQLNPITYLPMPEMVFDSSAVTNAWINRYELTANAHKPLTLGWTLGQFFLASCRMGSPENAKKDLDAVQPCHGADPMWIQFYESSFWERWHVSKSYYFPMHALYQQAFTDALVQDWRGFTDVFACLLPGWDQKEFSFHGITTIGGASLSGKWKNKTFDIIINPGKSKTIDIRIPYDCISINVSGQEENSEIMESNKVIKLFFDENKSIVIRGKTK